MTLSLDRLRLAIILPILWLGACAQPRDHVVFVTKTALGVDFDSAPATAAIGYDRIEGYIGPRASDGKVPPVLASIQSSGGIFNSDIRQTYATGAAALAVARGLANAAPVPSSDDDDIKGKLELMFFGTSSTAGLKLGFTANAPSSVTFGYKRKEVSVIPLALVSGDPDAGTAVYRYPSVIAAINTTANAGTAEGTALTNAQFFATGAAAESYASSAQVQRAFRDRAAEALQQFDAEETRQRLVASDVLACYAGLLSAQRPVIWTDAQAKGLLAQEQEEGEAVPPTDAVLSDLTRLNAGSDADKALANQIYAQIINQPIGFAPGRVQKLVEHKAVVCG